MSCHLLRHSIAVATAVALAVVLLLSVPATPSADGASSHGWVATAFPIGQASFARPAGR